MPTYCLNTSTIREAALALPATIDLVADAGYGALEPWIRELDSHVEGGGTLRELRTRVDDRGIAIPNLIGFFRWCVDDAAERTAAFAEAQRNFAQAAELGCPYVAAPPFGATEAEHLDLDAVADRFAALMELGHAEGALPLLEFWGHSRQLCRLGHALFVLSEVADPAARLLADVFHMAKQGTDHAALRLCGPQVLGLFHVNDYPAADDHGAQTDADRVLPGDGVAPLAAIAETLRTTGYDGVLSLELFNRELWARDPAAVAAEGLARMRAIFG